MRYILVKLKNGHEYCIEARSENRFVDDRTDPAPEDVCELLNEKLADLMKEPARVHLSR